MPETRMGRSWLRRILTGLGALVLLVAGLYVWALLSTDSSLYARAIVWLDADTDDWQRFPSRPMEPSLEPLTFGTTEPPAGALETIWVTNDSGRVETSLDTFLEDMGTTAFIVLQDDQILAERYFNESSHTATQTSFSVAKSFVSTLIGIAIDEGYIGSLDDPVTDYIPELAVRDDRMSDITIRNLVSMSSGLRYHEAGLPWTDDARTYYSPDLRRTALSAEVEEAPGTTWLYNNYNPLLLGMVLERATGMPVTEYLETRLWQPMGAEGAGSWSIDSNDSGFEKMESGINGRAIDFLKLGRLFLNGGRNGDDQVVSADWVAEATRADTSTDPASHYQYFWWIDEENNGFYAEGNHGQFIYVAPDRNLVILRMGSRYGIDDWSPILTQIVDELPLPTPPEPVDAATTSPPLIGFSIPVGVEGVTYEEEGDPPSGPTSFAVRQDGTVVVADTIAFRRGEPRLLVYGSDGRLSQVIDLARYEVAAVVDVATDGDKIAVLDVLIQRDRYRLLILDGSGELERTYEIPPGNRFENGLTGLAWDEGGPLLEFEFGTHYVRIDGDGSLTPEAQLTLGGDTISIESGPGTSHIINVGSNSFTVERATDLGGIFLIGRAPDGSVAFVIDEVSMRDGAIAVNRRVERYTSSGQLLFAAEVDSGLQYVDIQRPFELTSNGSIAYLRATETQLLVDILDEG